MTTITAMNPQTRDPLIRLPYETWLECLSLAIQDSADGPLPYLAVSPNWSETILSSPALWSQVIIDNGEDEEARLHTVLHLSASQLLDVKCARNIPLQLLQLLAQHRTRIMSIVIDGSTHHATIPTQLWSSLGNPKMRRLAFRDWKRADPIARALIPACPSLRSLEANGFIDESMIAVTLEEASISIQTLANLGALYKCTHLRSLTVTRALRSMPEPEVRNQPNHFLQLSSHLGPCLVNLEIRLSLKEFILFVPCMPLLVALYSATLKVRMPDEELPYRIAIPTPSQGALNLRMLSLELIYRHGKDESSTHSDAVRHILDYLSEHQFLPDLHTFRCDSYPIHVEAVWIAPLLRRLFNARVLGLIFGESETNITSTYTPIHMPNLLELSLRPISWLARIEAPNLIRLDYDSYGIDNDVIPHLSEHFGNKISHLVVDETMLRAINMTYSNGIGLKFESLQTLQANHLLDIEWVVHLPSIRTIDFKYPQTLHFLLLDLLRHPGTLPNLSTIKIHRYPCWELLFEVLRRRNTAQMHRIQELVLPTLPILAILSRLVELLRGHTDVYTNRDIDEVIYKRSKDESFNDTCPLCLSSGYIGCLEPVSLNDHNLSPRPFLGKVILVDLLTLESTRPVDEQDKYRGWGDWETLMKEPLHSAILFGGIGRREKIPCSRFGRGDVTISEYTLSGIPVPTSLS